MSTRFDAAGDRISFAGTMFAVGSGFTITAWAYVSVDTDANQTFGRLHASSGGSTIATWATGSDGLSGPNYFTGGGSITNATNMAVGAWRKIAISCSGTTGKSYVNTIGGTTEVDSGTVSVGTPDGITLGGRAPADSSEPFNGRLAYVRVWTAELTQTQIETEWASTTPVRTANLWASWPLTDSTDLTDHSGNGRNLSAGSTAVSTEADPPLSGSVTGTALAAFGGLTATATGVPTVRGTGAAIRWPARQLRPARGRSRHRRAQRRRLTANAAGVADRHRLLLRSSGVSRHGDVPSHVTGTDLWQFGGLTVTARGSVPGAPEQGSWYGLLDILREGAQLYREEQQRTPTACLRLRGAAPHRPGGVLYCPFDGSTWAAGDRRTGHVSTAGR
jgi:hypothetical protein